MPTTTEPGATWGKQERERAHAVNGAFHRTFAPQVKQVVIQVGICPSLAGSRSRR